MQRNNNKFYKAKIIILPAYILLFLMVFVPVGYKPIKLSLLIIVLCINIIKIFINGSLQIHHSILNWFLFIFTIGSFFTLEGIFTGGKGALPMSKIYVLYPFIYLFLIEGASKIKILKNIAGILVIASIAISLYSLLYFLNNIGIWPDHFFLILEEEHQKIGVTKEGYIKYSLYSTTSMVFLLPFLISALLTWVNRDPPIRRFWLWIALTAAVASSLLSGRRILLLIIPFSFFLALLFQSIYFPHTFSKIQKRSFFVAILIVFIVSGIAFYLQVKGFYPIKNIVKGFYFNDIFAVNIRIEQIKALLSEWEKRPLFGAGLGSSASGLVRNIDEPWSYEVVYASLLLNVGIVGFIFYFGSIAWIYWKSYFLSKSNHELGILLLPILVGTACILIANLSNPYLNNFSFLWPIFLPVAIINFWLNNKFIKYQCSNQRKA